MALDGHAAKALAYFYRGYSCAQSVLAAFMDVTGLSEEQSLRLASGFGGGIGRLRLTCGAFCSITAVCGFVLDGDSPDVAKRAACYAAVQALEKAFVAKAGALSCAQLLHMDENEPVSCTPSARTAAFYQARPCADIIRTACDTLDQTLPVCQNTAPVHKTALPPI